MCGTLEREGVPRELRVVLSQGEKRLFALGKPLARLAELYGQLNAVLFSAIAFSRISGAFSGREASGA